MASPRKNLKRRSIYGNRQSITTNKSYRLSLTDRVKYKCRSDDETSRTNLNTDALVLITQHTWNLYRVSHLYNVEYSTAKLKQYGARIRNELIKNITDSKNDVTFSAKVEILSELKESNEDSNSLRIDVFCKKDENQPILKYRGIILFWGNNTDSNMITQLPLLLCIGALNVTKIVHRTLYYLFDSLVQPLRISEDDLMWLSAILSDSDNKKSVCFEFSLTGSNVKNPIVFSLPSSIIKNLWNHKHPPELEDISYKEVQSYHKEIQDQLEMNYGLNFKVLKLNKILMCDAIITCEGKIKMYTDDAAVKILSFLNDIAVLIDTANPDMSADVTNT